MTTCLNCNDEEELLLCSCYRLFSVLFAKFLKIESCFADTCLGGLVVGLYDINFDSIAKSIDLFDKFLHDIFELKSAAKIYNKSILVKYLFPEYFGKF